MSDGPVINRKAGRSLTPNKARPSEPSPAPEPTAAPAVESAAQETPSKRSKASNSLQNNLDLQAQARVWHFNGTFSFWDNLGIWKVLIYALVAWSLKEAFWTKLQEKAETNFRAPALILLYRLIVFGALVLFGIHWKNDVCKDKSISEWYWGFRRSSPFLANVFEGAVIMAASQVTFQLYMHYLFENERIKEPKEHLKDEKGELLYGTDYNGAKNISNPKYATETYVMSDVDTFKLCWDSIKIMAIVSALFVTPVLTVFYKWLNEKWTLGGKWGSALFAQLVFSPVYMIFLLIFIDWVTALVNGTELWKPPCKELSNGACKLYTPFWEIIEMKFTHLNTFPVTNNIYKDRVSPYLSKQAINFAFWFPQTVFANFFVLPEYTLAFGAVCSFVWNIVFEMLVRK